MTPFEFVFFLYAIMLSLALTHLVGGWAHAFRNASRINWSIPYVLWSLSLFLLTTGNLTSFWLMRDAAQWNAWLVLSNFAFAITNYLACVFIVPDAVPAAPLDLERFHHDQRRRYLGALALLEIFAIAGNIVNGLFASYDNWLQDLLLSLPLLLVTLIGMFGAGRWVQIAMPAIAALIGLQAVISSSAIIGN
jgi:hypothetical protein